MNLKCEKCGNTTMFYRIEQVKRHKHFNGDGSVRVIISVKVFYEGAMRCSKCDNILKERVMCITSWSQEVEAVCVKCGHTEGEWQDRCSMCGYDMEPPCDTCDNQRVVPVRAKGCRHQGNCPCGFDEAQCPDCTPERDRLPTDQELKEIKADQEYHRRKDEGLL